MKKLPALPVLIITLFFLENAYALRQPRPPRAVSIHQSIYKDWEVEVINTRELITNAPAKIVYKHKGAVLWEKILPETPGIVNISYDGRYIFMAYWENFDEDWYGGAVILAGDGRVLKEMKLSKKGPLLIKKTAQSKDGHYLVLAKSGRDNTLLTFIDVWQQKVLWEKGYGLKEIDNLQISDSGEFILLSTYDLACREEEWRGSGKITVCDKPRRLEAVYINNSGRVIWDQLFDQGYAWNREFIQLAGSGLKFSVFNLKRGKWLDLTNENNKMQESVR